MLAPILTGSQTPLDTLLISRWAKANFVSNTLLDQSSMVKFIEFNWNLPAMGNGATDAAAGSINMMFPGDLGAGTATVRLSLFAIRKCRSGQMLTLAELCGHEGPLRCRCGGNRRRAPNPADPLAKCWRIAVKEEGE